MHPTKVILLVSFDLKSTPADYAKLWELMKGQEGWSHYLPATWLIATKKTAGEIADEIKENIKIPGDRFIVVRVQEYSGWMPKEQWEWIRKHRDQAAQLEIKN